MHLVKIKAAANSHCSICQQSIPEGTDCYQSTPIFIGSGPVEKVTAGQPTTMLVCTACFSRQNV